MCRSLVVVLMDMLNELLSRQSVDDVVVVAVGDDASLASARCLDTSSALDE